MKLNISGRHLIEQITAHPDDIDKIDFSRISLDTMRWADLLLEQGATAFHLMAYYGKLALLPKEWLTSENLIALVNTEGDTPLHKAAEINELATFPKELLTKENLILRGRDNTSVLHSVVRMNGVKHVSPAVISSLSAEDWLKDPHALRTAYSTGHIPILPKVFLEPEFMLKPDEAGTTHFHHAVCGGNLHQLPDYYKNPDLLELKGKQGTPLDYAAIWDNLDAIPFLALDSCGLVPADRLDKVKKLIGLMHPSNRDHEQLAPLRAALEADWTHVGRNQEWAAL